jgi:hypothetical protein
MDDPAYALRRQLGRPVTDKTGLSGDFDFDLTWATEEAPDSCSVRIYRAAKNRTAARFDEGAGWVDPDFSLPPISQHPVVCVPLSTVARTPNAKV